LSVLNNSNAISAGGAYNITDSLRLRSSASADLTRTPTTAGNRKTWTWSGWVKRGKLGSGVLWSARSGNTQTMIYFDGSDKLRMYSENSGGTTIGRFISDPNYRDPSAWYHIVAVLDASNATASDRVILYVNGVRQSISITTAISNADHAINSTIAHTIGREATQSTYFDGYITEVHFVDGQALTASYFGETNADGVWSPKKYTGTYGTNGFYLNFSDGTSTTTLGYDYSGNSNNWTTNNISLTAGTTYDLMSDVPSLADEDTANFATLNPLNTSSYITLSNANLTLYPTRTSWDASVGTIAVSSGKWYYEYTANIAIPLSMCGWATTDTTVTSVPLPNSTQWLYYLRNGEKWGNGTYSSYTSATSANDVVGVALDMDAGTLEFYINGVSQGVAFNTGISGKTLVPCILGNTYAAGNFYGTLNFGQRPFKYTPPTGYKKLNTYNLPDSSITDGSQYFNAVTYTGDGSTSGNSITGVGFEPDFVWIKSRNNADAHVVMDSVRGYNGSYLATLAPSFTNSESAQDATWFANYGGVTSLDSDGFTIVDGSHATIDTYNGSGDSYVAWNWRASDSSAVSNTDGTITSTVSANTTSGFSVITFTGNGTAGATIGHGLGAVPKFIVVKNRTYGVNWRVYHASLGATKFLSLNLGNTVGTSSLEWNNTTPTSSVITVGTSDNINRNGDDIVMYAFADVEGFSKIGSYVGNGVNGDGPFVYTGFRPAFILFKNINTTQNWIIHDVARDTYNYARYWLSPNTSGAEYTDANIQVDLVSNGFKIRTSIGTELNGNGNTIIYIAFAENPFKNSLAR
jgi:hypothetical protein